MIDEIFRAAAGQVEKKEGLSGSYHRVYGFEFESFAEYENTQHHVFSNGLLKQFPGSFVFGIVENAGVPPSYVLFAYLKEKDTEGTLEEIADILGVEYSQSASPIDYRKPARNDESLDPFRDFLRTGSKPN